MLWPCKKELPAVEIHQWQGVVVAGPNWAEELRDWEERHIVLS